MPDGRDEPLVTAYDLLMLDLDGVVYVGQHALDGAPARIAEARDRGAHVAFVTNNASRTPETVAAHLLELGITARSEDVVTSAQAQANASRLQVGWVRENGVILPVPSLVDERYNLVYGSLKHFSAYSLMTPHDEDY